MQHHASGQLFHLEPKSEYLTDIMLIQPDDRFVPGIFSRVMIGLFLSLTAVLPDDWSFLVSNMSAILTFTCLFQNAYQ